jgi:hypothetical protein
MLQRRRCAEALHSLDVTTSYYNCTSARWGNLIAAAAAHQPVLLNVATANLLRLSSNMMLAMLVPGYVRRRALRRRASPDGSNDRRRPRSPAPSHQRFEPRVVAHRIPPPRLVEFEECTKLRVVCQISRLEPNRLILVAKLNVELGLEI